jgi:aldehyde dehydrogenase (NAD+)
VRTSKKSVKQSKVRVELGLEIVWEAGPFLSLIPVADYDEAISDANSTDSGLSMAIFTENVRLAFRTIRELESGLVYVNAGTTGSEIPPLFGGMKQRGNG